MTNKDWREVKQKYWRIVEDILKKSDLILNILDARFYQETRNPIIEKRLRKYRKKFIFILNKSDLILNKDLNRAVNELRKKFYVIPISCKERHGKLRLIGLITKLVRRRPMTIGIVGYPNTGKSSVINYLSGKSAARTSSVAGFTRGLQWINLSKSIKLIDTPGVIPLQEKSETNLAMKDTLTAIQDPESVALKIIESILKKNKKSLEERYSINAKTVPEEVLQQIAEAKHKLKKQGILDLESAARMIINDWQKGKLKP